MSEHDGSRRLGRALVRWFRAHKRTLPWRVERNPYRVWVSEVMLQQTRVDTVLERYPRFLERFPSVHDLANAAEDDVLKAWEGLGYYSRARNMRLAAREIVARYGGEFPQDTEELQALPGIGRYTAAAIASIAFNRPVAAVDGNVLRVVSRLAGITEPITRAAVQRRIQETTAAMIPPGEASEFTEALMELGALVCTPGQPDCGRCPWTDACIGFKDGVAADLPNRPKRTAPRVVAGVVAVVGDADTVLVTRRASDGLLGGMWEFPWVEVENDSPSSAAVDRLVAVLRDNYGAPVRLEGRLPDVRHVFSHLEWRLQVFAFRLDGYASDHQSTGGLIDDMAGHEAAADKAAADETAADEAAADETAADEAAADETAADEAAADDMAGHETAADETAADETAADETAADETAADETAADEATADETAADKAAADETAADKTAADETAADEAGQASQKAVAAAGASVDPVRTDGESTRSRGTHRWIDVKDLDSLAFGRAHRRIADAWLAQADGANTMG